jgi:POT family proton-dependent oligopeptide transporter
MESGVSIPGFVVGAMLIAIGLGGVQASIQPFIGTGQNVHAENTC